MTIATRIATAVAARSGSSDARTPHAKTRARRPVRPKPIPFHASAFGAPSMPNSLIIFRVWLYPGWISAKTKNERTMFHQSMGR